jgi:hypothetical protein
MQIMDGDYSSSSPDFETTLQGSSEVPPNGSAATGFADIDIDTVLNQLTVDVTFSGLVGGRLRQRTSTAVRPRVRTSVSRFHFWVSRPQRAGPIPIRSTCWTQASTRLASAVEPPQVLTRL